jgi:hypothetical protein
MNYHRYFKPGQQLLLKALHGTEQDDYTELMRVFVISREEDSLLLSLPYGADAAKQYPFHKGLLFEITAETMRVGIRATGSFLKKIEGNQFTLQLNPDLQMFQRRFTQRFDCELGVRFSRTTKNLQTVREIWKKNIEVLHSPEAPLIFDGFKSCQVNISSSGIRFSTKTPGNQGEICLILINLGDGKPPVCAITEAVWSRIQDTSAVVIATRFINILSEDQQRIDTFITKARALQ